MENLTAQESPPSGKWSVDTASLDNRHLAELDSFIEKFHREFEWYNDPFCTVVFPNISQVQFDYIQKRFGTISTAMTIIRQKAEIMMGEVLRLKQCDGKIAAQKAQVEQEISEQGRQTQKDKALRAGLYESFVKGILTRAEYLEMQEDYSQKISGAVERVQQLQTRQSELERQVQRYTSMADKLAAVDKDTALSSLLVDQLIERVTVNGPEDVSIDFAFESGFEYVMEVLGNE